MGIWLFFWIPNFSSPQLELNNSVVGSIWYDSATQFWIYVHYAMSNYSQMKHVSVVGCSEFKKHVRSVETFLCQYLRKINAHLLERINKEIVFFCICFSSTLCVYCIWWFYLQLRRINSSFWRGKINKKIEKKQWNCFVSSIRTCVQSWSSQHVFVTCDNLDIQLMYFVIVECL